MLDPNERIVYEMGGLKDIRKAKVCMYFSKNIFRIFILPSRIFTNYFLLNYYKLWPMCHKAR